jgi:type IV secretion system protein VirB10
MISFILLTALAFAQASPENHASPQIPASVQPAPAVPTTTGHPLTIPSGTRVPIVLKHAISTKGTHEGDAVYAETTFPVVQDGRVLVPAGTYVQGRISHIQRAGHLKGRAEVLMHFSTLIYPSGYTVMLPGAVENAPGVDKSSVKDQEGTITQDSQAGQEVGTIASSAGTGALIGGLTNGAKGGLIGAGVGGAVGTAIALLNRNNDVKLDIGTSIEMEIQREVPLDASRVPNVTSTATPPQ